MKTQFSWVLVAAGAACAPAFAAEYLSVEQAQKIMFPDATAFRPGELALDTAQMQQVAQLAGVPARSVRWRVVAAFKGENLIGHMVLDEVIGKFELISYAVGIDPDARVQQIEILTYRESHGGEIRDAAWRQQFSGKQAQSGMALGEGIANISGATLSCTHVTDGVRRIAAIAQIAFKK
jgi:Na+-translocating ferredoxin:NAD+ oxidoreductase RnfG subunit